MLVPGEAVLDDTETDEKAVLAAPVLTVVVLLCRTGVTDAVRR